MIRLIIDNLRDSPYSKKILFRLTEFILLLNISFSVKKTMSFGRVVGSSVQNFPSRFQKTAITDPVSIPQNQHRFRRVLNRKHVACSHFRNVYPGESSTRFYFSRSFFCKECTRSFEIDK